MAAPRVAVREGRFGWGLHIYETDSAGVESLVLYTLFGETKPEQADITKAIRSLKVPS